MCGHPDQRHHPIKKSLTSLRVFREAVVDVLIDKTVLASKIYNVRGITLGGGVAANSRLRQRLQEVSKGDWNSCVLPLSQIMYG